MVTDVAVGEGVEITGGKESNNVCNADNIYCYD